MSKRTVRAIAERNGHVLPNFKARRGSNGELLYYVSWCEKCKMAIFSEKYEEPLSAHQTPCEEYTNSPDK